MKTTLIALSALAAVALAANASEASAEVLNLSGQYQCVKGCVAGPPGAPGLAYVTQNYWDLNLVNEVGTPARGWIDWPGHLWIESWNEGAVYSPDGMTIQFDRGTVWQRVVVVPVPPPPPRRRHHAS